MADYNDTDNLEELKRQWKQLSARFDNLEETNRRLSERLSRCKVTSLQEQLAAVVGRWGWIGLALPVLSPMLYFDMNLPLWYCILYGVFGLVMMFLSLRFSRYVRSVPLTTLPVAEAIKRATLIKLRQTRMQLVGFVMAMLLIGTGGLLVPEAEREAAVIGAAVGMCIGLAISIPRCVANARLARKIVEELGV